jgi:very-short-patch-repair endonuclease
MHNKKILKEYRKDLRNNGTSAEAFLWTQLSSSKIEGRKFRRQHSIGNYTVDFFCRSERLIIELDGEVHLNATAEEKDQRRTEFLENLDYKVIRFENKMVFDNLQSVLLEIKDSLKK